MRIQAATWKNGRRSWTSILPLLAFLDHLLRPLGGSSQSQACLEALWRWLTVADGDLSQAELDSLILETRDAARFPFACEALRRRGLLEIAFERLDAFKEQIPMQNMPSFVQALFDMSDDLPKRQPGLMGHDLGGYAWRFIYFGLRRETDTAVRLKIVKDAMIQSSGLDLPIQIVSLDERVGERVQRGQDFLFGENELEELKAVCVKKLRQASKTSKFLKHPNLLAFLFRWSEWTTKDEVRAWVEKQVRGTKDAVWLLTVLMGEMHSWGRTHRVRYYISLVTVELFVDAEKLNELIKEVNEEKLPKKAKIAVTEFRLARKRRAEGKPDDAWKGEEQGFEEEIDK
jgi:hypothetical protein